ncbi:MAG TPA: hypothetical protein VEY09_16230 [Pyrinomonadaceae bacterium]|nr:hypothetical protein [Pyrinomonadaceae bacterium]
MDRRSRLILTAAALFMCASQSAVVARPGRNPAQAATPPAQGKQTQAPAAVAGNLEKVKLILSDGFEVFVKDLNENGRLGYRLEKSLSYGGAGMPQGFAAVLRLDPGSTYEYDWLSSPSKNLLDVRLNTQAGKGFNFANAFALTFCDDERDPDSDTAGPTLSIFRYLKGNAYLVERKNGGTTQTREYRVVSGKIGPRKDTKKAIEAALAAAPPGFRPVKMLFSKEGWLDFAVTILLEKNLGEVDAPKIEYRLVKEATGFDKAVNALAAQGFRFVSGGRVGTINFALMGKQADAATVYTYFDDEEHAKKFDRTVAQGNRYQALISGEQRCESLEVVNQKLLFAQAPGGAGGVYKVFNVFNRKTARPIADSLAEFQRLIGEGYQVRDLFYSDGLNVIFER